MHKNIQFILLFSICLVGAVNAQTPITFNTKTDFTTGDRPYSVSIGDLNGDGKPDLAVTNGNSNSVSVFLNTTANRALTPTFSSKTDFTTGTWPSSVSIEDLNGDGKPDLTVTNANSNSVSVFLNTTANGALTPTFSSKTDFTTGSLPACVSIGDINNDGKPDLAVANLNSNSVSVFLNTTANGASTPTFSSKTDFTTGTEPISVTVGDLNGDNKPDLAATNEGSNSVSVFFNTTSTGASTPTFSSKTDFTTGNEPGSVSIGDLNDDGKPDLAVANDGSNTVSVLLNTTTTGASTPSFSSKTDFTTGSFPGSISIGDVNADSKPDLTVVNSGSNNVSVLLNTTTTGASTPTYSSKTDFATGSEPNSVSIGDLNGDGMPDLAVVNESSNSVSVLLNTTAVTGIEDFLSIPNKFALSQNFPNPFNPSTNISFSIIGESFVMLKVYDILGKEVAQLVNQQLKTGNYNYSFNVVNLTSGVYFYRLTAISKTDKFIQSKKMVLLK